VHREREREREREMCTSALQKSNGYYIVQF
jgi:hypothetical protein